MKYRILIIFILLCSFHSSIYGFIDNNDEKYDKVLTRLDELKSIKGVLMTGKGFGFFENAQADGKAFKGYSRRRDMNHWLQFDLNLLAVPHKNIEIGGALRLESPLNGFWGDGSVLSGRDIYAEVILFRFLSMRVGHIYEEFTPLTLSATVNDLPLRNELLYSYHRKALYDNYLDQGEKFPFQGINLKSDFTVFNSGELKLKGLASKIEDNDSSISTCDRYLTGAFGRVNSKSQTMKLEASWVALQDLDGTKSDPNALHLYTDVTSLGVELDGGPSLFSKDDIIKNIGVKAEMALSSFRTYISNLKSATEVTNVEGNANDFQFFIRSDSVKLQGGYRLLDYEFVSPGAQTRILTSGGAGSSFSSAGIKPFRSDYYYRNKLMITKDNSEPMNFIYSQNIATPNRKGMYGNIDLNISAVSLFFEYSEMEEVTPIGRLNKKKRAFNRMEGYASLHTTYFEVSGFYITEENLRKDDANTVGSEREDFTVEIPGAEVVIKPLKKLSLFANYIIYTLKGRKIAEIYPSESPLKIAGYSTMEYDLNNELIGGGLIYAFNSAFKVQADYMIKSYINNDDKDLNYDLNSMKMFLTVAF